MKKVLFTIGMVAILVGVVFGSIALATPASAGKPTPTPNSYMDWVSSDTDETILTSGQYNEGAHFSLTILATSIQAGEKILVKIGWGHLPTYVGDLTAWTFEYEEITEDGLYEYQFDAGSCQILTQDVSSDGVGLAYAMTITSPP